MMPSFTARTAQTLLLGAALLLGACDDNNTKAIPTPELSDEEKQRKIHEESHGGEGEEGETQGEFELVDVSPLQGQWRVVRANVDETPVVRANIIMDKDATDGEGDYIIQGELGNETSGVAGQLLSVRGDTSFFFFTFNPTADLEQLYTVTATSRVDDNLYKGTLKDQGSLMMDVNIARVPLD